VQVSNSAAEYSIVLLEVGNYVWLSASENYCFVQQYAAVKGISQVVLSRITMAAPGMCKCLANILRYYCLQILFILACKWKIQTLSFVSNFVLKLTQFCKEIKQQNLKSKVQLITSCQDCPYLVW